ncbi:replication initiator protein A [Bythopirellula goksoeyrii]|uniref:Replication initiator protein A n=1 Tax=Bythopirellula goksoeyrii TaxID=1400387 RepID=A0A5B9QF30_9BACT|nr:replication initiator protein A [Bythopirellula goksoeyrii]QEG36250.1 Replication initiator protein A [Bythopirellula goksoeyrii]
MGQAKRKSDSGKTTSRGVDGLNLVEFPLSVLSTTVPKNIKTLEFNETKLIDGKPLHQKLTITGSDKYGLPTITHHKLLVALLQVFNERGDYNNPRIEFTRYELLKKVGWPDDAHYYRVTREALKIWKGVTLYYENAWWVDGKFKTKGFSLIDDFELFEKKRGTGRRTKGEQIQDPSYVVLGSVVVEEFRKERTKGLDYEFYQRLKYPVSKQLYRYLDKWFWYSPVFRHPDVLVFAQEKIGLSRNYDTANLKRLLDKGIKELTTMGYLRKDAFPNRYTKTGGLELRRNLAKELPEQVKCENKLELELQKRGVSQGRRKPTCAGSLIDTCPESLIAEKIAVHDWLVEKSDPGIQKNPAGYLVDSIRHDWPNPSGYKSKELLQAEAESKQAAERRVAKRQQKQQAAEKQQQTAEEAQFQEFVTQLQVDGSFDDYAEQSLRYGLFKRYFDQSHEAGDIEAAQDWQLRAVRAHWNKTHRNSQKGKKGLAGV